MAKFSKNQMWYIVLGVLFFSQMKCDENFKFDLDQENTTDFRSHQVLATTNDETSLSSAHNTYAKVKHSADEIRGPFGANSKSSYVETVIVIDNSLFRSFRKNIASINRYCKDLISFVNSIYSSLNLFVILTDVVVWTENDKIKISNDSRQTLDNFLNFKEQKLSINHPNDLGIFLTNHTFDNSVIGKAYIQAICLKKRSAVLVRQHSLNIALVASTIAHEIGHVIGLSHDEKILDCKSNTEKSVMSEVSNGKPVVQWSTCSRQDYQKSLSNGINLCLKNRPKKIFDSSNSYCGNGFVEPGEECDCGLPSACKNKCCNPKTCKLTTNALCGTGECCDLNTCQIKRSSHQCRNSNDECDLAEYCNGISEFCPQDIHKNDGTTCEYGQSYCFQGVCGSREKQCKLLWGTYAISRQECYSLNIQGNKYGYCGKNSNTYEACYEEDKHCGLLQCSHAELLGELTLETKIYPKQHIMPHTSYVIHNGNKIWLPCKSAEFELERTNPGLTPNGAKCGHNKLCINQKCVHLREISTPKPTKSKLSFNNTIKKTTDIFQIIRRLEINCHNNCFQNGVCSKTGKCECFDGYLPPFCQQSDFDYDYNDTDAFNETFPGVTVVFGSDNLCPDKCNHNGICTEKGICECFEGFEVPSCLDKIENSNFQMIVLLGVIGLLMLALILVVVVIYSWKKMKKRNELAEQQTFLADSSKLEKSLSLETILHIEERNDQPNHSS